MSVRIHELARRIGLGNKELLQLLKERGFDVKTVSSPIDRINAEALETELRREPVSKAPQANPLVSAQQIAESAYDSETQDVQHLITQANGSGSALEYQVHRILDHELPHSFLSSVPIFRPDAAVLPVGMATELDFVLHAQTRQEDLIIIIECKSCPILFRAKRNGTPHAEADWVCRYREDEKSIKRQLLHQRIALLRNIEPLPRTRPLRVVAIVASNHPSTPAEPLKHETPPDYEVHLLQVGRLQQMLRNELRGLDLVFLRVQQSEILRRLRLSLPIPEIGHPEIPHAIEYTARARKFIDGELFRHLRPAEGLWAINGSAGMGKSMLLAYGLLALVTDMTIGRLGGLVEQPQSFSEDWSRKGVPKIENRRIWAVAQTEMQVATLQRAYTRFVGYLSDVDKHKQYIRITPQFKILREVASLDECNVLLVDEAHDLTQREQVLIANWWLARGAETDNEKRRYLIVACDRHQKLRMIGSDARIVEGLSFSGCSVKLDRNYRNPFAVYAGSIALLFRWFAEAGPKVIPTEADFRSGFSFNVESLPDSPGAQIHLAERNDAHPANNWSHVLSEFPSAHEAYQQLTHAGVSHSDVLWLRFDTEDPSFNYQHLACFTYHPVLSKDASATMDRYVKGQEFPIVVLEGLPEGFDDTTDANQLWQARRLFYLAASRATVFLYLILPAELTPPTRREFDRLFQQLGHPPAVPILAGKALRQGPSGKFWELRFERSTEVLTLRHYLDIAESESFQTVAETSKPSPESTPIQAAPVPEPRINHVPQAVKNDIKVAAPSPAPEGIAVVEEPMAPPAPPIQTTTHPPTPPAQTGLQQPPAVEKREPQPITKAPIAYPRPASAEAIFDPTLRDLATYLGMKPHIIVREAQKQGTVWVNKLDDPVDWMVVNRLCKDAGVPVPTKETLRSRARVRDEPNPNGKELQASRSLDPSLQPRGHLSKL